jgi:hypothetical protein
MYAYTCDQEQVGDKQVDIDLDKVRGLDRDFAYWRKFNNLHQWMADLYFKKGGQSSSFNCNTVRLMREDLDRLAAEAATLKPASGFFWGDEDDMTPEATKDVLEFVERSRLAIANGKAVIYDSWW